MEFNLENLENWETQLSKSVFLKGFSESQEDKDLYEKLKNIDFDEIQMPNLMRWKKFMKELSK